MLKAPNEETMGTFWKVGDSLTDSDSPHLTTSRGSVLPLQLEFSIGDLFDLEVDLGGEVGEGGIPHGLTFLDIQLANLLDSLSHGNAMGDSNYLAFRHSDVGVTVADLA